MTTIPYIKNSFYRKILNTVVDNNLPVGKAGKKQSLFLFATRNQNKLAEYERLLGEKVDGVDLKVPEIQDPDPIKVLEEKARAAYALYGEPVYVEDSSLTLTSLDNMIGPYADNETNSRVKLEAICRMYLSDQLRSATLLVGIALFDGQDVYTWIGETKGSISERPKGDNGFGFDPIFIPFGTTKTFAELSDKEKDVYSPRRLALEKLQKSPHLPKSPIFALQEPSEFQLSRIQKKQLVKNPKALRFAFSLQSLQIAGIKPNTQLLVNKYVPFVQKSYSNGAVREYTVDPTSASMGLILLTEVDVKTVPNRNGSLRPIRLETTSTGDPVLFQMGPKTIEIVLASRIAEYLDMHSTDMHDHVRDLLSGKIPHVPRSNTPSPVLEGLLGMRSHTDVVTGQRVVERQANIAIATKELGYKRLSSEGLLSRKKAAQGILMLGPDGVVSSLYSYGGMPPTTGSVDSLVTAAMSYMRGWIPRNGVFAGNFPRQLALFKEAKEKIMSFGLPKDIQEQVIAQIGIAVGCDNPQEIALQMKAFRRLGGHAARIYTTNPDRRIVETAKAIRDSVGPDFLICVGPVTDEEQAIRLKQEADVQMFLVGHGGGENCTSLTAGGAANSVELLYLLYLNPLFNDCLIGLEGGTGTTIGALLPLLDVISLNKRGIGGYETTQGLYYLKARRGKEEPVIPYHGSASAATQLIESYMDPTIAKRRLGLDGIVRAVEGKVNYLVLNDALRSNVNAIRENRSHAGLALADQQSLSLYQLRKRVKKYGHNHIGISSASSVIAGEHRSGV
ncbi:MAG TPA: non-canonical purine NTP pyrophosphatase [Candidatus Eisenbacteria bacterium]|nr:non-canonical purine NTP pyrophosphatase [Candidatus Eisenbacteria bacterium]